MGANAKEAILAAARELAQAHGYGGLNFRDLGEQVGIRAASLYHHFPSKEALGAAVARRYWEDTAAALDRMAAETGDARASLRRYPEVFRAALENGNRMCLCSFMAAETDDLPEAVMQEVRRFADVNIAWLGRMLADTGIAESAAQARAIFAAIAGAQLIARSRGEIAVYDAAVESYRKAGLLP